MSVFNKIFCFIFGCILVVAGVIAVTDALGFTYFMVVISDLCANGARSIVTLLAGVGIFMAGMILILANLCLKPPKAVKVPGGKESNAVYVTLSTIENMAKTTALSVAGVVAVSTKIKSKRKGLCLKVKINVSFDDKINGITEQLQKDIRALIEGSTSLPVHSVTVLVVKAAGEKNAAAYRGENREKEATVPLDEPSPREEGE